MPAHQSFTLSFAASEETHTFGTPAEAGCAFADAPAELGPRIIAAGGRGARIVARSMRTGSGALAKAAPRLEALQADPQELDLPFWTAYHAAAAN